MQFNTLCSDLGAVTAADAFSGRIVRKRTIKTTSIVWVARPI